MRFDWQHAIGAASLDDFSDALRKNIYAFCSKVQTKFYRRRRAEKRLEEEACLAIAFTFQEFNPDRRYIVKKDWPRAFVMIARTEDGSGYEALIEPWLGHDDVTSVDGIDPVRVPIEWGQTPITVLSRIRSALPWGRREAVLDVALDPAKPQQPRAESPRPAERDLAPTGLPEGATRRTQPATPQSPPAQNTQRPTVQPKREAIMKTPPKPSGKPRPRP